MKESKEYKAFEEALEKVLSVTHSEIKRREDDDRMVRKYAGRPRKPKTSVAVDRASREKA